MVSSERIESRRARTQDGDAQTRGRPLVRQRMRTENISVPRPERREAGTHPPRVIVESTGTQEPDENEFPSPSAPPYGDGWPSAPPAHEVLTPPMVTPPESPEHIWDPLPMPDGYLPGPVDLDADVQPEVEDDMIDEGEPVELPEGFDDEPSRPCDVLRAYYQKGGSSSSTAKKVWNEVKLGGLPLSDIAFEPEPEPERRFAFCWYTDLVSGKVLKIDGGKMIDPEETASSNRRFRWVYRIEKVGSELTAAE